MSSVDQTYLSVDRLLVAETDDDLETTRPRESVVPLGRQDMQGQYHVTPFPLANTVKVGFQLLNIH